MGIIALIFHMICKQENKWDAISIERVLSNIWKIYFTITSPGMNTKDPFYTGFLRLLILGGLNRIMIRKLQKKKKKWAIMGDERLHGIDVCYSRLLERFLISLKQSSSESKFHLREGGQILN